MQTLAYDHREKFRGGCFLVMRKGYDEDLVEKLKKQGYTKGFVAGYCAINEVGDKHRKEFRKRKVFFLGYCNNLAEPVTAMLKLSKMRLFDLVAIPIEEVTKLMVEAQNHGSSALIPALC